MAGLKIHVYKKVKRRNYADEQLLLLSQQKDLNSLLAIVRSPQLKTTCAVFLLTTHVSWYLPSCRCGSIVTLNPPLNPPRPPPPSYTNTKKLSTIVPTICTYDKQNALTIRVKMHAFEVKICNFKF